MDLKLVLEFLVILGALAIVALILTVTKARRLPQTGKHDSPAEARVKMYITGYIFLKSYAALIADCAVAVAFLVSA